VNATELEKVHDQVTSTLWDFTNFSI